MKGCFLFVFPLFSMFSWIELLHQISELTQGCIKVPKYLECVFECSKEHSEKKLAQKSAQQIKSTFLSPQIIAQ